MTKQTLYYLHLRTDEKHFLMLIDWLHPLTVDNDLLFTGRQVGRQVGRYTYNFYYDYYTTLRQTTSVHIARVLTQCDQIWRNFAPLAKISKYLANQSFYLVLQIVRHILCHWAHFHFYIWQNFRHVIQPSGHTGAEAVSLSRMYLPNSKYHLTLSLSLSLTQRFPHAIAFQHALPY